MVRLAAAAILVHLTLAAAAPAGMTHTITDTQPIIDWPLCRCGPPLPGVLDFALFDFSGQGGLCSLSAIELSLTMQDGDTGPGDFDHGNLFLGLNGVNTGLRLDGFKGGEELSLAFSLDSSSPDWISQEAIDQILAKLNEDGLIFASIIDVTPDDNNINLYSIFDTTLRLTGTVCTDPIPEPASLAVWGLLAAAALYGARRRRSGCARSNARTQPGC
jgi:hypothetical protein